MGCGVSFARVTFDPLEQAPEIHGFKPKYISASHLFCLVHHIAIWPDYYCLVDTRDMDSYEDSHVLGAVHHSNVTSDQCREVTVIVYDRNPEASAVAAFLLKISETNPADVYILNEKFSKFKKKYQVVMSHFELTEGEQPGPVELIPATKNNPALYVIHRNQFQHCKTTIAYLGCNCVINISSKRLFLKTAAIRLENILFDNVNEPYDEAIAALNRYLTEKPKSPSKSNILMIDENNFDFAALIVGWYFYKSGYGVEDICDLITLKMGDLDPWYLNVLRAWADKDANG